MHAVGEIHVGRPRRPVERLGASSAPMTVRVTGGIMRADVRFHLHYAAGRFTTPPSHVAYQDVSQ